MTLAKTQYGPEASSSLAAGGFGSMSGSDLGKDEATQAAASGVPYVCYGGQHQMPSDTGDPRGFGSAYDFPQNTQAHFEGYGKQISTPVEDDALGPDWDGDSQGGL